MFSCSYILARSFHGTCDEDVQSIGKFQKLLNNPKQEKDKPNNKRSLKSQ